MADLKITGLDVYTTMAGGDLVEIVDISDTAGTDGGAGGTNKQATISKLIGSPSAGQFVYATGSPVIPAGTANLAVGSAGQLNFGAIAAPGSPTDGDEWYDSTALIHQRRSLGLTLSPGGTFGIITAPGTAVANTSAQTSLMTGSTTSGSLTFGAGKLNVAGRTIAMRFGGIVGTKASSPNSFNWKILLGATTVLQTNVASAPGAGFSAQPWCAEAILTVDSTGSSGTVAGGGLLLASAQVTTGIMGISTPTPGTAVTIDLTASQTIDIQIAMALADAANTVRLTWGVFRLFG